jgi:c-di-GMP-binding flagellar brake protein YcgR
VDLSLGGLQLRSRHQYEAGSIVDVSIGRGDTEPIALKAEVRYSLPVKKSDLFATGLKFVTMDEASTHKWVDYVHNVFKDQGENLLAD